MTFSSWPARLGVLVLMSLVLSACAPAASPSPTVPPAAKATEKPAPGPTDKPSATTVAEKPAAKPSAATKAAFDEKTVADFYKGKTVRIVVGLAPGGGYDVISRLIARYLPKHIPGNPTVIVENVAGAGSLVAMNQIYNTLPKDGTVVGNVTGGIILLQLSKDKAVEFDASKMQYLGTPNFFQFVVIATKQSGHTSVDPFMTPGGKQIILGQPGVGSGSYNTAVMARDTLGMQMNLISGYDGSNKVRLAMESGEIDGTFTSWDLVEFTDQYKSGDWRVLAQLSDTPIKGLETMPNMYTYAKTDEQKQMLKYGIFLPNKFARLYVLAPTVPEDRVRALQAAYDKTMTDSEFLAEAQKAKIDMQVLTADQVKQEVLEYLKMPQDIQTKLARMFG